MLRGIRALENLGVIMETPVLVVVRNTEPSDSPELIQHHHETTQAPIMLGTAQSTADHDMNCPKCESKRAKLVSDVAWMIPWDPFKDANGKLHKHDPNKHFVDYRCSNGHVFEESYFPTCTCGWQAEN